MQVFNPDPGVWYANHVGQLLQVRTVLYVEKTARRVLLDYINGRRESVSIDGWFGLNLTLHFQDSGTYAGQGSQNILVE